MLSFLVAFYLDKMPIIIFVNRYYMSEMSCLSLQRFTMKKIRRDLVDIQ